MNEEMCRIKYIYNLLEDDLSKDTFMVLMQDYFEGRSSRMEAKKRSCYDDVAREGMEYDFNVRAREYFRFPERLRSNIAMVDCGSYDGRESIYFSEWCNDNYSKIYAFEPCHESAEVCKRALKDVRADVFEAALSDENSVDYLYSESQWKSYLSRRNDNELGRAKPKGDVARNEVKLVRLDDIVCDDVGFLKVQAMGAEYQALLGAKRIIITSKPMISVVVNSCNEIMIIIDYLNGIVPEYCYLLRQYHDIAKKTPGRCILLASIK